MTERIEQMRTSIDQLRAQGNRWSMFYALAARSLATTEGEPLVIRRAKAEAYILDHAPLPVLQYELICGSAMGICNTHEELSKLDEEQMAKELDTWSGVAHLPWSAATRLVLDNQTVLDSGLRGIEKRITDGLAKADGDERRQFYQAARIALQAAQRFILRYANALSGEANRAKGARGEELTRMAVTLRRTTGARAETFAEGLQLIHMLYTMMCLLGAESIGIGRLDLLLGARYSADLAAGRITEAEAEELIACFLLKLSEPVQGAAPAITLGGVTPDGADACSRLTEVCLRAARGLGFDRILPRISVRVNPINPDWLLDELALCAAEAGQTPHILGDNVWIERLIARGFRLTDANNYVALAGGLISMPGRAAGVRLLEPLVLPALLGRALDKRMLGELALGTFDQLMEAVKHEVRIAVSDAYIEAEQQMWGVPGSSFDPFASMLIGDCLARGAGLYQGGSAIGVCWTLPVIGLASAADALAAVKTWVYDKKKMTMMELVGVQEQGFEGRDRQRQMLLNAPRFGQDDDFADEIARQLTRALADAVAEHSRPGEAGRFACALCEEAGAPPQDDVPELGATAEGRKPGDPVSAGLNPAPLRGVGVEAESAPEQPTRLLNSALKLDPAGFAGGAALTLPVSAALRATEAGKVALRALIAAYTRDGGAVVRAVCEEAL